MRFLVTGGAGFIGSNYVRRLVDGSLIGASEITVIDKLTYAGDMRNLSSIPKDSFRFIQGNICNQSLISNLIKNTDVIVNFAAESHVDRSIENSEHFIETNVKGVQVLLDTLKNYPEKMFVQVSTDEVYGSINEGSWNEDSPLMPNSPYSASKASAELLAKSYFKTFDLNIKITRSSNNYGPYQHPEKLIPLAVTNIIRGRKIPIYGDGMNVRDWIHVDDNCKSIHRVLLNGKEGEIFNIGAGNELSNLELIRLILSIFEMSELDSIEYVADRKGHDSRYSIDSTKLFSQVGFLPTIQFKEGLKNTLDWYRSNHNWWIDKIRSL